MATAKGRTGLFRVYRPTVSGDRTYTFTAVGRQHRNLSSAMRAADTHQGYVEDISTGQRRTVYDATPSYTR